MNSMAQCDLVTSDIIFAKSKEYRGDINGRIDIINSAAEYRMEAVKLLENIPGQEGEVKRISEEAAAFFQESGKLMGSTLIYTQRAATAYDRAIDILVSIGEEEKANKLLNSDEFRSWRYGFKKRG